MTDPKHIVDNISSFLAGTDQTVTPELAQLATDYAELCREANARLRRCADFLRQGLRCEAIQFADCQPRLLDLVSALDLREIAAWEQGCAKYALPRPVRLLLDAAKTLNDAYAEQEPLQPLLVQHRLLALTNSPLPERLSLLRKLAAADAVCPSWAEDVGAFELARFSTLKGEATAAIKSGDGVWVDRLLKEVKDEPWRTPVPDILIASLTKASASFHEAEAIQQLRALVPQVSDAYSAMNLQECRQVFARWSRIVKESKLKVPQELLDEVLPLSQWLDQQDDRKIKERGFRTACAELASAIDLSAPAEELRLRHRHALSFELDLPPELEAEYRRKLDAHQREDRAQKRREWSLALVLVLAVAAALGALAYVILHYTSKS